MQQPCHDLLSCIPSFLSLLEELSKRILKMSKLSPWTWFLQNVLCFPLIFYIDHNRQPHHQPDTPCEAPWSLPVEYRQLSSKAHESKLEYERTSSQQLQSRLFRLPDEIRLQIYKHAIGGRLLHINLMGENKKRKKEPYPRCHTCKYGEYHVAQSEWTNCSTHHDCCRSSLTPLLRTCRRV